MPITWRNVDAPNLRDSISGINSASQLFDKSARGLGGIASGFQAETDAGNLAKAKASILGATTSDQISAMDPTQFAANFGLSEADTGKALDMFNVQRDAVQADELSAAEEARRVADEGRKVAKEGRDKILFGLDTQSRELSLKGDEADVNTKLRAANTASYLDSSNTTINAAIAGGANEQQISDMISGLETNAPNADAAGKIRPLIQAQIAKRDALSPEQQRQHTYLVNSITNQANASKATADTQLAAAQQEFQVSPTYGIMSEMEKGADWVGYINEKAPEGWFGGSRGDAAGAGAKNMIQRDIKTLTNDKALKDTLVKNGLVKSGDSFKIPNEVILYTLQQQIVDPDDKQVDLSTFRDELASNLQEYLRGRYNQGELGKAQSAYNKAIATIAKDTNNRMGKSYDDVKKNKLFN